LTNIYNLLVQHTTEPPGKENRLHGMEIPAATQDCFGAVEAAVEAELAVEHSPSSQSA
jgi:hypothetical protein